jgi:hypothetical protein
MGAAVVAVRVKFIVVRLMRLAITSSPSKSSPVQQVSCLHLFGPEDCAAGVSGPGVYHGCRRARSRAGRVCGFP